MYFESLELMVTYIIKYMMIQILILIIKPKDLHQVIKNKLDLPKITIPTIKAANKFYHICIQKMSF